MDNLISVFMNYKMNRLVEYGVVVYNQDSSFIRQVLTSYFQTYIDNYYYGVFNTLDEDNFNRKNLKAEFTGIMEEMLYDYQAYENKLIGEEYQKNCSIIRELRDLTYEIVRIDTLSFRSKEEVPILVSSFIQGNEKISNALGGRREILVRMIRETYTMNQKLLNYKNEYFDLDEDHFIGVDDCVWVKLVPTIKSLNVYKPGLVQKAYEDETLTLSKMECLIQKISHLLLMNCIEKKESKKMLIEIPDSLVSRGKLNEKIASLIDNPMFQKNVVLAIPYNTYVSHKGVFSIDFQLACIQDFSHISDIYQKVDSIYNEAVFDYLVVRDCRYDDRDYFINYKNNAMDVLMFEEE